MDRCALFVDAGYALADGAMAVHGTRRRDSVTWDHAGLLKLLAGLARDRTGLPVLRCYWYETAAEGRRTSEHDALAEMPGLKLRLVNALPGRREGIEGQLRRDLVTLAKSGAISDAFIASANEHIAEIVAEVQDLGLRVVVLHIASDSGWTIPLPLRQECDDIVEISGVHLRPFVDLIRGAEPATDDHISPGQYGGRRVIDANSAVSGALTHQGQPAAALPAPGVVYQVQDGSEYRQDRSAQHSGPITDGPAQQPAEAVNGYHNAATQQASGSHASPTGNHSGQTGSSQAGPGDYEGTGQGGYQAGGSGYQAGGSGYQAGGNGYQAGGNGYQAGGNGYQNGSGGYQNGLTLNGTGPGGASIVNGSAHTADSPSENAQNGYHPPGQGPSLGQNGLAPFGYQVGSPGQGPYQGSYQGVGQGDTPAYQNGQNGNGSGQAPGQPNQLGQSGQSNQPGQSGHTGQPGQSNQPGQSGQSNQPGQSAQPGQPGQLPASGNGVLPGQAGHGGLSLALPAPGTGSQGPAGAGGGSGPANGSASEFNGVPQQGQPLGAQPLGAPVHSGYQPGQNGTSQGHGRGGQAAGNQQSASPPSGLTHAGQPPQGASQIGSPHAGSPQDPRTGDPYGQAMQPGLAAGFEPAPIPLPVQHGYGSPEGGFAHGPQSQPGMPAGPDHSQRPALGQAQPHYQMPHGGPGPQPGAAVASAGGQLQPRPQPVAIALPDAVKAAHAEGFTFGESVGRDAPGLWLEAVLARKPRMPSDLEARLLQGSVLPIDSLLHDEVRHSLRRGFWDALESARR